MASASEPSHPSAGQLAEISALADGTLAPERREIVEARLARSPQLRELFEREQRTVRALHEARARDRAPDALRARVQAARPSHATWPRRRVYAGALAGAVAACVVVLGLVLPAGSPGGPSLSQAAALGLRGPTAPAPAPDPRDPGVKLHLRNGTVYFPDFSRHFGWRASGQRHDRIGGRSALTVFYDRRGHRVSYTIVSAPALHPPPGQTVTLGGVVLRTLRLDGRLVVTWRRQGHTCVLSGVGVNADALQHLAAWRAPAS